SALTCGEVLRVTNATRTGDLRLSDSTSASNFTGASSGFGSLMRPGLFGMQAAILADSPEVNCDQHSRGQRKNYAMQHVEAQQRVRVHGVASQHQEARFLSEQR